MLREEKITENGIVTIDKVEESIRYLKAFEPHNGEGYFLAFSGGKDSCVLKSLADKAGVKYDAHYYVTSVDPPVELSINVQSKNTQNLKQPYRPYLLSASSTAEVRAG